MTTLRVSLSRDSFNTAWGFRLQGGKDVNQSLVIQRVFTNSPAEGVLQRGDVLVSINGRDAATFTHKQAQDTIKFGGGQIDLVINRPPAGRVHIKPIQHTSPTRAPQLSPKKTSAPVFIPIQKGPPRATTVHITPSNRPPQQAQMPHYTVTGHQPKTLTMNKLGGRGPDYGTDFTQNYAQPVSYRPVQAPVSPGQPMISRVQESLDNIIMSPTKAPEAPPFGQYGYAPAPAQYPSTQPQDDDYEYMPVGQRKKTFSGPAPQTGAPNPPAASSAVAPDEEEDDYPTAPVMERRRTFMKPEPKHPGIKHVKGPKTFKKPVQPSPYASFGQDYSGQRQATRPVAPHKPMYHPPPPQIPVNRAPPEPEPDVRYEPSWRGTLKSSSGPKPWDMDVERSEYSQPEYQSHSAPAHPPQHSSHQTFTPSHGPPAPKSPGDGPKVVHLQYNSPMEMYSQKNIEETLHGQIHATQVKPDPVAPPPKPMKPEERDWTQSYVYQMIHGQPSHKPGAPAVSKKPQTRPQQPQQQQQQRQQAAPRAPQQQSVTSPTYQSLKPSLDYELGVSEF